MKHRWDAWDYCERCGLSRVTVVEQVAACETTAARVLALRRFEAEQARAPLMAVLESVWALLAEDCLVPNEFASTAKRFDA